MEIAILCCVNIVAVAAAAYFFADSRANKTFIVRQSEWLEVERQEKLEWASRVLVKNGSKPLFHTPEKKEDAIPSRRVVTRAEAAARPQQSETLEKAREILNKV